MRGPAAARWARYHPGFHWTGPWRLCPLGWARPWASDDTHRGVALVAGPSR